jgi:hypothetical protein
MSPSGDFDSDGDLDLVTAALRRRRNDLPNNGNGTFTQDQPPD